MKRFSLVLFLVILIYPAANGQLWKLRRYELTGSFGTSQFMGDIGGFTPGENALGFKDLTINNTRFSLGLGMRYRFYEKFSVKLDLNYGLLRATDIKGSNEGRDMEAITSVFEPGLRAEYYILKNSAESSYRFTKGQEIFASIVAKIDLYAYAGVAPIIYSVNPNDKLLAVIEKDGGTALGIPLGVGVNYLISPNSLVGIDMGYRLTTTDYLDGYTSQYSEHNDVYYFMTFVFTHKLKTSEKGLPSFRK
jgi:hypothetical protein